LIGTTQAPDCFPSPLIKLNVSISNIQLSDWFHRSTHATAPHLMVPSDDTEDCSLRTATQRDRKVVNIAVKLPKDLTLPNHSGQPKLLTPRMQLLRRQPSAADTV
jgi:hypothetical protein